MKTLLQLTVLACAICALPAAAAVSPAEAAKLGGPEYNEVGALRAGNADGSIPPYSGKMPPAGAKPPASAGKWRYGELYPDEKPLYSIDAKNLAQYGEKLSEGTKTLLQRYPTYRVDVYPGHRDQVFPNALLERTKKCATTAKLVGNNNGLEGAQACIPFPLPKNGYEVMWNAALRYYGYAYQQAEFRGWLIDAAGNKTLNSHNRMLTDYSYWDPKKESVQYFNRLLNENIGPAGKAGTKDLRWSPLRGDLEESRAWQYIAGQRRVRLAPEFKYDTVATATGGLILFDEIGIFDGRMDRFDFSKATLKEIIVPFSVARVNFAPIDQVAMKNHVDPKYQRWELRRVWVVEATLAPGARHIYSKRHFYIDADSWSFVLADGFDQSGKLYRTFQNQPVVQPDIPAVNSLTLIGWDLTKDIWGFLAHLWDGGTWGVPPFPLTETAPDALAGSGIR